MPRRSPRDVQDGTVTVPVFQREDVIGSIPWVAVVPTSAKHSCEGISRAGSAPIYLFFKKSAREDTDPEYAAEIAKKRKAAWERHSCKKNAHWVYVLMDGTIKRLCTDHMYSQGIWHGHKEHARFEKWYESHYKALTPEEQED